MKNNGTAPHIFCIIGEESGDNHASSILSLVKEKLPELKITGTGGENFRKLSQETHYRAEDMSVIGIWEVLKKYRFFKRMLDFLIDKINSERPDFLFLVDYPGCNIKVADSVKKNDMKIIYFIAPQVWAWKKKRVFTLKRLVDYMIVIFPFEVTFFKEYGDMDVICYGHPFLDVYKRIKTIPSPFPVEGVINIAVLPGSRPNEITRHLPALIQAMKLAKQQIPNVKFWVMKAKFLEMDFLTKNGLVENDFIKIVDGYSKEYIYHSHLAWCCSGTATIECAILKTAPIIFYKISPINFLLLANINKDTTIGMPNIILEEQFFSELKQDNFSAEKMLIETFRYLNELKLDSKNHPVFEKIHTKLGENNVYQKIADSLVGYIQSTYPLEANQK